MSAEPSSRGTSDAERDRDVRDDAVRGDAVRAAGFLGLAMAAVLFAALAWAPGASPAPGRTADRPAGPPPTPTATPAPWQPLVDLLVARAVDGDALVVVERTARGSDGRAVARAVADAAAAQPSGPRLSSVDGMPSTAAAAANRLAGPLAAPRVWVAWPRASAVVTDAVGGLDVPPDDPVRAWLDGHGRAVDADVVGAVGAGGAVAVGHTGRGGAAWAVGAWEHVPSLDGGDYPPVVVPEPLGAIELVGWSIAPLPLRAGRAGRVRAAWRVGRDGAPDVRIAIRLVDGSGRVAAELDERRTASRLLPVATWPAADITVVSHNFTVGREVPAGSYDVAVNAFDPATGDGVEVGAGRVIGAVSVAGP